MEQATRRALIQEKTQKRDFSQTWGSIQEWRSIEADTVLSTYLHTHNYLLHYFPFFPYYKAKWRIFIKREKLPQSETVSSSRPTI